MSSSHLTDETKIPVNNPSLFKTILLPNSLPFSSLDSFFSGLYKINDLCRYNIQNISFEYLIEDRDITLFKYKFHFLLTFLNKRDIDFLCGSNFLQDKKRSLNITKQNQISITKTLMLIIYASFDIVKIIAGYNPNEEDVESRRQKERNIPREYVRICLITMKIIRKLFMAGILDESDLNVLIKLKFVTALFDRDILKDCNNMNNIYRLNGLIINPTSIFNCFLFIISSSIKSNTNNIKTLSDDFIVNILLFFDNIFLNNYTNRLKLAKSNKKNRFFDIARISPKVCETTIKILLKLYKYNFNINDILEYTNELFFSDNIIKNVSGLNLTKNELIKLKANTLDAQIQFISKLFEVEKEENNTRFITKEPKSTSSSNNKNNINNDRHSVIHIQNGFYFSNDDKSGIFTQIQGKFPKDGYAIVVSFNLMVNEVNHKKYTVYTIASSKDTIVHLYVQNKKLKLQYPNQLIDICDVEYNKNYLFWFFHSPVVITKKYSKAIIYVNDVCYDKFHEFYYINESDVSVSIGVKQEISNDKYHNGNFPHKSVNCFQGIIGTFILFNHNFKDSKREKILNLLKFKGQYEDIIHLNCELHFWHNNSISLRHLFKPFISSNILNYLYLIISSRSISPYSIEKNILNKQTSAPIFKSNYCDLKPQFQYISPQLEFHCIPDIDNRKPIIYPITTTNSYNHFFHSNGVKFLIMNIYFYTMHLQNEKTPFMSNDELNRNIGHILELFFVYWASKHEYKHKSIQIINNNDKNDFINFFYAFRILLDNTRNNNLFAIGMKVFTPFSNVLFQLAECSVLFKECDYILSYDNYDKNDTDCLECYFCSLRLLIIDKPDMCLTDEMLSRLLKFHQVYLTNDNKNNSMVNVCKQFSSLIQAYLGLALDKNQSIKYYWNKIDYYVKKIEEKNTKLFEDENSSKLSEYMIYLYKYLKNLYIVLDDVERMKKFLKQCKNNINNSKDKIPFQSLVPFKNFNHILKLMNEMFKYKNSPVEVNISKELYLSELIKSVCLRFINDILYNDNSFLSNAQSLKDEIASSSEEQQHNYEHQHQLDRTRNRKNSLSMNNILQSTFKKPYIMQLETEDEVVKHIQCFNDLILTPYTMKSLFLFPFRDITNKTKIKFIKSQTINSSTNFHIEHSHYIRAHLFFRIFYVSVINKLEDLNENAFCDRIDMFELYYNLFYTFIIFVLDEFDTYEFDKQKETRVKYANLFHKVCYIFYKGVFQAKSISGSMARGDESKFNSNEYNAAKGETLKNKIQSTFKEIISRTIIKHNSPFYFKLIIECCPLYQTIYISPSAVSLIKHMINALKNEDKHKNLLLATYIQEIKQINSCKVILLIYQLLCMFIKQRDAILQEEEILYFLSNFPLNNEIFFYKLAFPIHVSTLSAFDDNNNNNASRGTASLFFSKQGTNKLKTIPKKFIPEIIFEILIEAYRRAVDYADEYNNEMNFAESLKCFVEYVIYSSPSELMKIYSTGKNRKTMFYIVDKIHLSKRLNSHIENEMLFKEKLNLENVDSNVNYSLYFLIKLIVITTELENESNEEQPYTIVSFLHKTIKNIISEADSIYRKYLNLSPFNASKEFNTNIYRKLKDFIIEQISLNKTIHYDDVIRLIDTFPNERLIYFPFNIKNNELNNSFSNHSLLTFSKPTFEFSSSNLNRKRLSGGTDSDVSFEAFPQYKTELGNGNEHLLLFEEKPSIYTLRLSDSNKEYNNNNTNTNYSTINNSLSQLYSGVNSMNNLGKYNDVTSYNANYYAYSNNISNNNNSNTLQYKLQLKSNSPECSLRNNKMRLSRFKRKSTKQDTLFTNNTISIVPKLYSFKNDLIKTTFSLALHKFLSYNEDFVKMKKIFKYVYRLDLPECQNEKHFFNYPTKYKNYITSSYYKPFLEHNFSFFKNMYFPYTHSLFHPKTKETKHKNNNKHNDNDNDNPHICNFTPKITFQFPKYSFYTSNKSYIEELTKTNLIEYNVELITIKGAYYGTLYTLDNCLLFVSQPDPSQDKRTVIENFEKTFACMSCLELDYLYKEKEIILFYDEIQETLIKRFLYNWIGVEIFLKNGKSYFFNLFTTNNNTKLLEHLKNKGLPTITDCKKHFRTQNYTLKWMDKKLSTFDYLLLLNKYSGRSFHDINQYPIFPWLQTGNGDMRDFNYPITLQTEDKRKEFKESNLILNESNRFSHGNHYSTSAYVCFYLMRLNPFTHNMIKLQSYKFDEPDRQFMKIASTLLICERFKDNREILPELFILPESFYNMNYNDFGKQNSLNKKRVHNTTFTPFGDSPEEFVYNMRNMLNHNRYVQKHIQCWFDYVFGAYQNKINPEFNGVGYCNYNNYCYEQFINFDNIYKENKKKKKTEEQIFNELRTNVSIVLNLGQVPFQLLDETHSSLISNIKTSKYNLNILIEGTLTGENDSSINDDQCSYITPNSNIDSVVHLQNEGKVIYELKEKQDRILFFKFNTKPKKTNYIITKKRDLILIKKDKQLKLFPKQYKLLTRTKENKSPIYRIKYVFCTLSDDVIIFCRYLNNTIHCFLNSSEGTKYLLNSFVTCILGINKREFITGHQNGSIMHFKFDIKGIVNKLELIKEIQSNDNAITALCYNERLNNIVISTAYEAFNRKFYNFEYINAYNMNYNNDSNITINMCKRIIVDVKVNSIDYVYLFYNVNYTDEYGIAGFTVNGLTFGKVEGYFCNFEFTSKDLIICAFSNKSEIAVYHPVTFEVVKVIDNSVDDPLNGGMMYFWFNKKTDEIIYCLNKLPTVVKLQHLSEDILN